MPGICEIERRVVRDLQEHARRRDRPCGAGRSSAGSAARSRPSSRPCSASRTVSAHALQRGLVGLVHRHVGVEGDVVAGLDLLGDRRDGAGQIVAQRRARRAGQREHLRVGAADRAGRAPKTSRPARTRASSRFVLSLDSWTLGWSKASMPEHRARRGRRDLPGHELLAQVERVVHRQADHRVAGPLELGQLRAALRVAAAQARADVDEDSVLAVVARLAERSRPRPERSRCRSCRSTRRRAARPRRRKRPRPGGRPSSACRARPWPASRAPRRSARRARRARRRSRRWRAWR